MARTKDWSLITDFAHAKGLVGGLKPLRSPPALRLAESRPLRMTTFPLYLEHCFIVRAKTNYAYLTD